jgi:hypothetical protein
MFMGADNTDAVQDMSYDRYMSQLRDYLGVTDQQTAALFARLKTAMS